jgi:hypothetical protein
MKTRWFLLLAIVFLPVMMAFGEDLPRDLMPSGQPIKDALRLVVTAQLDAFRHDDYAAAYRVAHTEFQDQMTVQTFERMVRLGYPAIAHSTSARFGLALDNGDDAVINVRIFSANAEPIDYRYALRRDGQNWRITGVTLLKDETTGV